MLIPEQKLRKDIFDEKNESVAIRVGFGLGLVEAGRKNPNIVGLCADLLESTKMEDFAKEFPKRFLEIGVAEQNLASVGSGMAAMGKIPFISSYAMFSPGRNWEQIRTTICYNDVPVKIIGSHAGISVGPDGGTHQAIEDIALMRIIPNMVVISPCDSIEAKKATLACVENGKPTYIRLAREATPLITTEETPFEIGKANKLFSSSKVKNEVAIIATGALVFNALKVAKKCEEEGIGVIVVNLSTIKPLDKKTILEVAKETGAVVTVEEHQIAGGMGSAVSEFLSQTFPVPMEFIGVNDVFGQSGKPQQLIEHYGMGEKDIYNAIHNILRRKHD
ncbi:MAG: transketolase family protein [Candidatus Pacebacteria bacterium]|nr:transketolase family protein [Candidatus Paceibacterota bacterium]